MYLPILRVHFTKRSANGLSNDTYLMLLFLFSSDFHYESIRCGYSFELHQLVMQFKWVPTTYPFTK